MSTSTPDMEDFLLQHGIKPTVNRLIVLKALIEEERPLSLMELEEKIETVDKSGIFRSLILFKEQGLLNSIEDGGDGARYELSHSDDEEDHVHFFCEKCHKTFCLDDVHVPQVEIPEGYSGHTTNYLIKGICPDCSDDGKTT